MDTLAGGTPACMYRQRPTSGEERTRRWGHIPALRRVDSLFPPGKGMDVFPP
jgi:hypothetical protein